MNQKSPKEIKRFASAVSKGHSLQRAMLDAGYAPSTARRGKAGLSKPMWEALARESNNWNYSDARSAQRGRKISFAGAWYSTLCVAETTDRKARSFSARIVAFRCGNRRARWLGGLAGATVQEDGSCGALVTADGG